MNELDLSAYRVERLRAAVDHLTGGNLTHFGQRLGYKDGAFVRQMLGGSRPVSEKTILKIESLHGMSGWFEVGNRLRVVKATPKQEPAVWPFPKIDERKVSRLNEAQRGKLEDAMLIAAGLAGLDVGRE